MIWTVVVVGVVLGILVGAHDEVLGLSVMGVGLLGAVVAQQIRDR